MSGFIGEPAEDEVAPDEELRDRLEKLRKQNGTKMELLRASNIALDPMGVLYTRIDALASVALDDAGLLRFELLFEAAMGSLLEHADKQRQTNQLLRP